MSVKAPARLHLPEKFPTAADVPSMAGAAKDQLNWYYDLKRVLIEAIEGLRKDRSRFESPAKAGTSAPTLGATAPALSAVTPYTWVEVTAPDGTPCVMPLWKKSQQ